MNPQPDEAEQLRQIVAECLDRFEQVGAAALDELGGKYPRHASELRRRIRALQEIGLLAGEGAAPTETIPERLGEFRLLRRIGGGGMGVVYLALQEPLGREVALKLVRPDQLFFPGARERFRREVETVARVQHPGIVAVHAVGEAQGIPYFAMERVPGCTLADAILELKGREPALLTGADLARAIAARTPSDARPAAHAESSWVFAGSYVDACLRLVRQAAEALEHAHRRGILHRDIKPSNVMVTPSGRVLLLDFGLASSQSGTKLTRTGAQLGSLPYMAPEQLGGDLASLDARADGYALGVCLYELIALVSPYFDTDTEITRRSILAGCPTPLRAQNHAVSWEAETVCLKAMERDRARRYASAADLARDLENVLARRPIEARRASVVLRGRRWIERRPAAAVAILLGSLLALAVPTAIALQEHGARLRIEDALQQAREQRHLAQSEKATADVQRVRAETNFGRALEAVQTMLTRLGAERLENVPQVQSVRREMLEDALRFYRGFLAEKLADPALREQAAEVHRRIGDVALLLGETAQAQAAFAAEREMLEQLASEFADEPRFSRSIASSLSQTANTYQREGKLEQAQSFYTQALARYDALVSRDPEHADCGRDQAVVLGAVGLIDYQTGRLEQAEAVLGRAIGVLDELRAGSDANDYVSLQAADWNELAVVHRGQHRLDQAEADHRRAIALRERLCAAEPGNALWRYELGESRVNLGFLLTSEERCAEAQEPLGDALDLYEGLARDYPDVPKYRYGVFAAALNLSNALYGTKDDDEAEEHLQQALTTARQLSHDHPEIPDYVSGLGTALGNLAEIENGRGAHEAARSLAQESIQAHEQTLRASPAHPNYVYQLACAKVQLARALSLGLPEEAIAIVKTLPKPPFANDLIVLREAMLLIGQCAQAPSSGDHASQGARVAACACAAAELLELMLQHGFHDWRQLIAASDLAAIRDRDELQQVLARAVSR
ncbi:MAG: serine/threonine-protein kinase [Planctomycetota bacterium]